MLAQLTRRPFIEIPQTPGSFPPAANFNVYDTPWSVAHQYGLVLYCPAKFSQAHIRLNHHIVGIELDPGIIALRIDRGPAATSIQKFRTFYFVPAGSALEFQKETPIEHLLLTFDPQFTSRPLQLPDRVLDGMVDHLFAAKAMALRRQFLMGEEVSLLACELARVALAAVSGAYRSNAYREASASVSQGINLERIRRALAFINGHGAGKASVADVADAVGDVSPFHFAHTFEAVLGQPPHQYMLDQRVRRAREMLMTESASITDIAYAVGFSSHAHMTRTFRRRLGVTPAQLRMSAVIRKSD